MKFKRSENYFIRKVLQETKIKEIMAGPVISIHEDEPFSYVEEKFREHGIRHLPVIDKENKLVGLITQKDLYRIVPPRRLDDGSWHYDKEMLDNVILKSVMIPEPRTFRPEAPIADALLEMAQTKYGCFPIIDKEGMLCGIITQIDIIKIAAQILKEAA